MGSFDKGGMKGLLSSRYVVIVLAIGALAVNFGFLKRQAKKLFSKGPGSVLDSARDLAGIELLPGKACSGNGLLNVSSLLPAVPEGNVPDPFFHPRPPRKEAPEAGPDDKDAQALQGIKLILCSRNSKRVVIGKRILGEGDSFELGTVKEITPKGIYILNSRNETVFLPLKTKADRRIIDEDKKDKP